MHPRVPNRLCTCGHQWFNHNPTPAGRLSWCNVWDGPDDRCECAQFMEEPPGRPTTPGGSTDTAQSTIEERTTSDV